MTKYEKYCHTLQRVCGLKYNTVFHLLTSRTRHTLQRVCGLKLVETLSAHGIKMSHPAKGVWIEIYEENRSIKQRNCHTLQRVCGLKLISTTFS